MGGELTPVVSVLVPAVEPLPSVVHAIEAVPSVALATEPDPFVALATEPDPPLPLATGPAGPSFLRTAVVGALFLVAGLCLPCAYRVVAGPTIPDRVVGIDAVATNVVSIAVLVALLTGRGLFVTIALVLAIIAFVTTVTVAKFVVEGDIIE